MKHGSLALSLVLVAATALGACAKKDDAGGAKAKAAAPAEATLTTGTVGADGVRTIAIEASNKGYAPATIPGKPGEKLKLVFTRTQDSSCIAELKTPDGKVVALPMNTPVEVPVTVPADGEVTFACGMDMVRGRIVAQKG